MNKNVFKYLRKKILEQSTITEEIDDVFHVYKIECLGFQAEVSVPSEFQAMNFAQGLLVDKLVEIPEFLKKLEQIENRKENLKSLLD
jgi:hypothetical protein